jgi:hypothetical protein
MGSPPFRISLLEISIHSPKIGQMIKIKGKSPRVNELNSYPSPSTLVELFCRSERLVTYLENRLTNPSGMRAGMPAENKEHITSIR